MGGRVTGPELETVGLAAGCCLPLPLGKACSACFSSCNSCVSLSRWWSAAVLADIGLFGVGSTVSDRRQQEMKSMRTYDRQYSVTKKMNGV